jgi:hypothetical protein
MFKAGLLSAVGTVCLTESYKFSPQHPGKETVKLIAHIFQQLVNISDGMPLESPKRTPSEVMVNLDITWFSSVVICIGCATFVTLIQQWDRRRVAHVLRGGRPHEPARLQVFLFRKPGRFLVRMYRVYDLSITGRFHAPLTPQTLLLCGSYHLHLPHRPEIDIQGLGTWIYLVFLPHLLHHNGFAVLFL